MSNRSLVLILCVGAVTAFAVSACASFGSPDNPLKDQQYVSVVNSLSWTNPLTGKRDGVRSSWPLAKLKGHEEAFPLAQLKQCGPDACAWGVLRAHRSVADFAYRPGGVSLDLGLGFDLDRRQEAHQDNFNTAMTIPADVPALHWKQQVQRTVTLPYGKVERIDLDYGLRFEVCALRYDATGHALDQCDIPYI
ncbi:hypothetical protein AAKU55_004682 [Oxalobacteraceae bacterium GrIS 1.11]